MLLISVLAHLVFISVWVLPGCRAFVSVEVDFMATGGCQNMFKPHLSSWLVSSVHSSSKYSNYISDYNILIATTKGSVHSIIP